MGVVLFNMIYGCNSFPFGTSPNQITMLRVIEELCEPCYTVEKSIAKKFVTEPISKNVSEDLKDLFSKLFTLRPYLRIGFKELCEHQAIATHLKEEHQYVKNYNPYFPKLSRL